MGPEVRGGERGWMDAVRSAARSSFPTLKPFSCYLLSRNLWAVCTGLKPSYLVDVVKPSDYNVQQLDKLVKIAREEERVSNSPENTRRLLVVRVGGDVFVINREALLSALGANFRTFVDISHGLNRPERLTDEKPAMSAMKRSVVSFLTSDVDSTMSGLVGDSFGPIEADWNMTTLFGVLLGYPVVYWYDDLEQCRNCLSCLDLVNFRLVVDGDFTCFSFSCPKSLVGGETLAMIERWSSDRLTLSKKLGLKASVETNVVNMDTILL